MASMLSWFSKPSKSNLPEPTALQAIRSKQIEQLRSFDCSVSEIRRDVEYRVVVSDAVVLYIVLPPNFPQEKPIVRVSPAVLHPWVDDHMHVTGCFALNNFMVQSDLGKVVKEIVDELRRDSPVILSAPVTLSRAVPAGQLPSAYVNASRNIPTLSTNSAAQVDVNYPPVEPPVTTFQELKDLTRDELKELLENDEKLLELLKPRADELETLQHEALERVERAAKQNIARKLLMEEKKRILLEKYDLLNDLRRKFDDQVRRQDELHQKYDLTTVVDNLKVAALEAEEKTEDIAERFLSGSITADEFHKSYMAERTLCHLRHAKEEKLSQSIRQRSRPF